MKIKMLVMDVDGTLTDGRIYMGADGEVMKAFDVRDGYGIKHILPKHDIIPVIITGRRSAIVERRCAELDITELCQGVADKLEKLKALADKYGLVREEIAYIGDDVNDIACIQYAGLSACPADALDKVRSLADYVCSAPGGRGAVRELVDRITADE